MNTHTNGGGSAAPQQQREKVSFSTNIPVLVQLEFDPPQQARAGRFGDQFMYFLADQKIMWVEPEAHAEILRAGAVAGSELAICKRELRNAGRKHIQWEVVLQQEEPEPRQPAHTAPPAAAEAFARAATPRPAASAAAPRSAPRTSRPVTELVAGNLMTAALRQAMEACEQAGFEARTEDVRALAITIYIAATGGKK
jgi:hypothetical protein